MKTLWRLLIALMAILGLSLAQAAGKGDHPLLGAVTGFQSDRFEAQPFGVVEIKANQVNQSSNAGPYSGPTRFEGKVTRVNYRLIDKALKDSELAVIRDYQQAIEKVGGKMLNVSGSKYHEVRAWSVYELNSQASEFRGHVLLNPRSESYELVFVEAAKQQYSVQAAELAKELQLTGFTALYFEFDTNRAELKPSAQPVLAEVIKLLTQQPRLRLSVEGHTDNVGDAAANKRLSLARAQAVVAALSTQGVSAARLAVVGQGQDMPVADNRLEAGRAKNRRVELVRLP
jgi:outer membrane protein OmpA-like peptidoglycan-associated protein